MSNRVKKTSWVIIDRITDAVMFETWSEKVVMSIDVEKFQAVEIGKYLGELNQKHSGL